MNTTLNSPGPASERLERELIRTVKDRGLVIWLDADSKYTPFVQALRQRADRGSFPFPVFHYDGSFLELMLKLENFGNGLHAEKVLIHMPGYNKRSIAETPLCELFRAGKSWEKALDTLLEEACLGLVRPLDGQAFRSTKPSLTEADRWLAAARAGDKDLFLIALEAQSVEALLTDLFSPDSKLTAELNEPAHPPQLFEYLARTIGLPEGWPSFLGLVADDPPRVLPSDVPLVVASWLMAVEFVTDLSEPPVIPELSDVRKLDRSRAQLCRKLIAEARLQRPDTYRTLALRFEDGLVQERQSHQPEALGSIDTFHFEERAIRGAALSALQDGNWDAALRYAIERKPEGCFWVRHDKSREHTWELIRLGADVGREVKAAEKGLKGCTSLEEATHRYRDNLHRVDRSHREFEQRFHKLYSTELEDEAALREARDGIRREYRTWANSLAAEFAKLCADYGPLPGADLRQRGVYEQFVHPFVNSGARVAYFMVDAMRYEMAAELKTYFERKKYRAVLHARLAELPTITEVGMNALAPVATAGRLCPVIQGRDFGGFRAGAKFTVSEPKDRVRAMETRSVGAGAIDVELSVIADSSASDLKKKLREKNSSPLIVVRSLELDSAGEKGFHLGTFERTLVQIRESVQRLQQLGVTRFVLVADHGFLLQDNTAELVEYGDGPKRRHVLSSQRSGMTDALEIPLAALDYDVSTEAFLVFRKDTAVWKVADKMAPFVHGGNSLQERVVPVLVLEKENKVGASTASYEVVATALPAQSGRERLELKVRLQKQSIGELSFGGPKLISLALRVVGREGLPLDALIQLVEVTPPGQLDGAAILVPPTADAATVVFSIEGETDERVRIEVYHPDATEQVTPKTVEGWFHMHRNRKLGPPKDISPVSSHRVPSRSEAGTAGQTQSEAGTAELAQRAARADWASGIEDQAFRRAFEIIESQGSINEQDLHQVLGGARRTRVFSREFDQLKARIPFEVQITTLGGMKVYVKGDIR